MACERELWAFIWVLAVVRDRAPSFRHCSSCSAHAQYGGHLVMIRKRWGLKRNDNCYENMLFCWISAHDHLLIYERELDPASAYYMKLGNSFD